MKPGSGNKSLQLGKLSFCLLAIFISFVAGRSLFVHVHHTPAGATIVHSHPFAGDHEHSAKAYEAIDFLIDAQLAMPECAVSVAASVTTWSELQPKLFKDSPLAGLVAVLRLRAPPCKIDLTSLSLF